MPRPIRSLTVSCSMAALLMAFGLAQAQAQTQSDTMTPMPAAASVGQLPVLTPPPAAAGGVVQTAPLTPMPASAAVVSTAAAATPSVATPSVVTPSVVTGAPAAPPALSSQDLVNPPAQDGIKAADQTGQVSGPTRTLETAKGKDTYYDSHATVPSTQMSRVVGPRKVNPAVEPGQAFVIVEGVKSANSKDAKVAAADRALAAGNASSALVMYSEIARTSSRDPHILMGRAVAQQKLGMTDAAIESYNHVLDASPNNVDAMVNMLGLLRQKDPQGALDHMRALGGRFPDDAGLAAQTGMAEGEAGNYAAAMRYLGKAAALQPENPQHPFNMAVLADRQGDATSAAKYYQLALTQTASAPDSGVSRDAIEKRLAVLAKR